MHGFGDIAHRQAAVFVEADDHRAATGASSAHFVTARLRTTAELPISPASDAEALALGERAVHQAALSMRRSAPEIASLMWCRAEDRVLHGSGRSIACTATAELELRGTAACLRCAPVADEAARVPPRRQAGRRAASGPGHAPRRATPAAARVPGSAARQIADGRKYVAVAVSARARQAWHSNARWAVVAYRLPADCAVAPPKWRPSDACSSLRPPFCNSVCACPGRRRRRRAPDGARCCRSLRPRALLRIVEGGPG